MFDNIGGKIKKLAKILCWVGIVLSVLVGLITVIAAGAANASASAVFGALLGTAVGVLASWIGSFFTYGFGQLVENSDKLVKKSESRSETDF